MFDYNADTGVLSWRERSASSFNVGKSHTTEHQATLWNSRWAKKPVGNRQGSYLKAWVSGDQHLVHRIIWKMAHGEAPDYIDHIDGDTMNNRIENLRSVPHAVNMKNKALYKNNSSGVSGVAYRERDKVWEAAIGVDGARFQIGSYKTREEAVAVRAAYEVFLEYHANHGRPKTGVN